MKLLKIDNTRFLKLKREKSNEPTLRKWGDRQTYQQDK